MPEEYASEVTAAESAVAPVPPPKDASAAPTATPADADVGHSAHFPEWHFPSWYLGVVLLGIVGFAAWVLFGTFQSFQPTLEYTNVYSLVPEKISKSAPIPIALPEGVSEAAAMAGVSFSPTLRGEWQEDADAGVIVFAPREPLKPDRYYAVNLDAAGVQMSGDFYVDEDPQIEAIFPAANQETPEDTEITIVFNRPMVPVTTLATQEAGDIPVTITPETPGRYRWISSRTLQFIPETTLFPASEYQIKIADGFVSVDGLPVAGTEHTFTTRPLRYEAFSDGGHSYRQPLVLNFNQAVDLDKTKRQIAVTNGEGKRIGIDVEYGERRFYDREERDWVTEPDLSRLYVYQTRDQHGRERLWDFETTYNLEISRATPLWGTIDLADSRRTSIQVPNVIESVTAQSEQTSLVRPSHFDPAGTLTITFYEPIAIDRSRIEAKGLTNIEYGKHCADTESQSRTCEQVDNERELILSFDASRFGKGESFDLLFERLVTTDGLEVNADPIVERIRTYPEFAITKTVPAGGANAPVDEIVICSNTPLQVPADEDLATTIATEGYIVYGRWPGSRWAPTTGTHPCVGHTFMTEVRYGLLPDTQYEMTLNLTDAFSQTTNRQLSFTTEPPREQYTRMHNLQKQYNVTVPERTTLTYGAENLEYVDVHICKMRPEAFLEATIDRPGTAVPPTDAVCTEVRRERVDLPDRYWVVNHFQVKLADYFTDPRGQYLITLSHPRYTTSYYDSDRRERVATQQYDRTYVSVTNLAVARKEIEYSEEPDRWQCRDGCDWHSKQIALLDDLPITEKNLYWVNNSQTLAAVSGAAVTQYRYEDDVLTQAGFGFANQSGIAETGVTNKLVGAIVQANDGEVAIVTDWADGLQSAGETRDASRTYTYTDRPIYRPGHEVHIRGIDRVGYDGEYEVWTADPVTVKVFDAMNRVVHEAELPVSMYGTFDTTFTLPDDASLGTYRIEALDNNSYFSVEEYVPAAFKLDTKTDKDEYLSGDAFTITAQADYYFGVPLDGGEVTYSVTAQNYYFDRYTDEYFNFGSRWYYCYSCGYGDDFLYRGTADIDENGQASISGSLDLAQYFDGDDRQSKLVTVSLTANDTAGRAVSAQKSFVVHAGEFYLGAKTSQYYTGVNSPITLRAKTVDTAGEPMAVRGIEQTVYQVSYETFKRQEVDGGFYYRSEKVLDEVSKKTVRTDSAGDYTDELSFAEAAQYEIHLVGTDSRGNEISVVSRVYIHGRESVTVPPNNNYELEIETETQQVSTGDMASVLIKSPYERAKVLITAERGAVYDYWVAEVTGGLYLHEFPITEEYAPNVFVSAVLLSPDPEVKYGSVRFEVDTEEHDLNIEVSSNKTSYLPGEEVTLQVKTTDADGRGIPAEVSIAVADLSVLALKGNPKKDPLVFFYDGFPLSVTTASNIKNILYEVDIPLGTKGGGGSDPDDLAKKQRGEFRDTAFWSASVETNSNGTAEVTFTLPDNLTTWQVETLGVTRDTKLGVDYREFNTKKELMAVPLKPRFIVPGDEFSLGAKVFNQTNETKRVTVSLESESLEIIGDAEDQVTIKAGETATVYVPVVAPTDKRSGVHQFAFAASSDDLLDEVVQSIPVTPNTTYETVASADFTTNETSTEYLYVPSEVLRNQGGVTITANATLQAFVEDALVHMVRYSYGCSEQLASALATIATVKAALDVPNVPGELTTITYDDEEYVVDDVVYETLEQIYEAQNGDGGFTYYPGNQSYENLSAHVIIALLTVQEAGYEVRDDVLSRVVRYLTNRAVLPVSGNDWDWDKNQDREDMIMRAYALARAGQAGIGMYGGYELAAAIERLSEDTSYLAEYSSTPALAYLALTISSDIYKGANQRKVLAALYNRIEIDGRGAYLKSSDRRNWRFYESPELNTALLLKVFTVYEEKHETLGNTLRWLIASRDKSGVWGSTHATFMVVDALTGYQRWQQETTANFELRGFLANEPLFETLFADETVFDTFRHQIPMSDLPANKMLPLTLTRIDLTDRKHNLYYDVTMKYYLPVEQLPARDEGITVTRNLYAFSDTRAETPLREVAVGEVVRGKVTIMVPNPYNHVAIEDYIPAGFEIINENLSTEAGAIDAQRNERAEAEPVEPDSGWFSGLFGAGEDQLAQLFRRQGQWGQYGNNTRTLYPTHRESHDDRVFLYVEDVRPGVHEYEYYLRALVPGEFQYLPARAEQLYLPEVFGRSAGGVITVTPAE